MLEVNYPEMAVLLSVPAHSHIYVSVNSIYSSFIALIIIFSWYVNSHPDFHPQQIFEYQIINSNSTVQDLDARSAYTLY